MLSFGLVVGETFSILSANAELFLILIAMALPLTAEVSYENRDRAVYDKEDDVFYGAESAFTEIEFTPIVKASCTLDRASNTLGDFYLITSQARSIRKPKRRLIAAVFLSNVRRNSRQVCT